MNKDKPVKLKIDWATHKAAKYACENWHYSRRLPRGKLVKIGAWEDGKFIGVVIFGYGATLQIGWPYRLAQTEICELTRIALRTHSTPVSRIIAIALKFLKRHCPGVRLIVSYADLMQHHHGGIYQASNWIYVGRTKPDCFLKVNGIVEHRKTIYDRYGRQGLDWIRKNVDPKATRVPDYGKHKYLMPLDEEMKKQIEPLRKPYPKRASSVESGTSGFQPEGGGESPTDALHLTAEAANG